MESVASDHGSHAALNALAHAVVDDAEDRRIKRGYLRWLPERGRVLDVGCGRGSFLDVARQAGLQPVGIDRDVGSARDRGFEVHEGELLAVLRSMAASGERFDGAVLAHVIEHQHGREALELLQAIAAVLAPGAPLVVVTPNSRNYIVLSELFWLDPTHVRPYPRALVERLAVAGGFAVTASYDDARTRPRRSPLRALLARLRSLVSGVDKSGPVDSVVVCRRL